jgi:RNA polymerase sigma-70 factor (ECF subfamily)
MAADMDLLAKVDWGGVRSSLPGETTDQAISVAAWLEAALPAHIPMLLAAARALADDESEARDLVQSTVEIALRKGAQVRDRAALPGWLLTVQTREALRLRRRLRRLIPLGRSEIEPSTQAPGPEAAALHQALAKLSPRVRAAIVLHHMAGLSVAEVAMALEVSPNTVKTQLLQGLAKLRGLLGDD